MHNHALAGLWYGEEVLKNGQQDDVMGWGGALNLIWFASRKHGVAGFAGTQFCLQVTNPLVWFLIAWRKEVFLGDLEGAKIILAFSTS